MGVRNKPFPADRGFSSLSYLQAGLPSTLRPCDAWPSLFQRPTFPKTGVFIFSGTVECGISQSGKLSKTEKETSKRTLKESKLLYCFLCKVFFLQDSKIKWHIGPAQSSPSQISQKKTRASATNRQTLALPIGDMHQDQHPRPQRRCHISRVVIHKRLHNHCFFKGLLTTKMSKYVKMP